MKNRQKVVKNLILGMFGTALLMAAEWLIGAYGEGNNRNGLIESNWAVMPMVRFRAGLILAAVAAPFFFAGIKDSVRTVNVARRKRYTSDFYVARLYEISAYSAALSMLFIMGVRIILPVLYKSLFSTRLMGAEIISTIENVFYYVSIPFYVYYWLSLIGVSLGFMYFVFIGRMLVPRLLFAVNPLVFVLIKELLGIMDNSVIDNFTAAAEGFGFMLMFSIMISFVTKIPARRRRKRRR